MLRASSCGSPAGHVAIDHEEEYGHYKILSGRNEAVYDWSEQRDKFKEAQYETGYGEQYPDQ